MRLPAYVAVVFERLEQAGFEVFVVGGAVRDSLMGKTPHDFDLTTNARPEQILRLFSDYRVIETGLQHGTVTVLSQNKPLEITTYRVDVGYSDGRHPDGVQFTPNIWEDLARRDFTMNAVCYAPSRGLYDPFGGASDIQAGVIRTVGVPARRFSEDGLRILRALRFSAVLDFMIAPDTGAAMLSEATLLRRISRERIYIEFSKLLQGKAAVRVLQEYWPVVQAALWPDAPLCAVPDFSPLADCPTQTDIRFAAFALCCQGGKAEDALQALMKSLKADKRTTQSAMLLVRGCNTEPPKNNIAAKRLLADFYAQTAIALPTLWRAFGRISDADKAALEAQFHGLLEAGACLTIRQLKLDGNDLRRAGVETKRIGKTLQWLLNLVIEEKCENTADALHEQLRRDVRR